ncbi:thioredoxin-disulfide reductase [Candidatus Roizmanbacteria bacterium CG_4_10_14_0_8_um_filter_39_9]|uniref:Thioredoxin-disulfide reductase n=1 Tax=Candidatus Roizmanbacteria bacterium CG_4_10_14_0_8_um_filter_39_9 TaxID=1974829 RepID=A0A2M7QCL8_9BACT|nr:MAG: thioredoxin-disulfide reductase [Candidatus Roizmanbacteria bacterium CG_4_10_14_0_8_um_filter_39_9]
MKTTQNVVIIGGGPAGLSAAIYLARAGLSPLLFAGSPPGGQLVLTSEVENFPGHESILGSVLIDKMRAQAIKFGTTIIDENVQSVKFGKLVQLVQLVKTKAVLIATGAKALWLGLESEQRLRGKGVSACATCDGFFFRNKTVAVLGGGDSALEEALTLTKFASKVYLIHRRDSFRASQIMQKRVSENPKIEIILNATVDEILGVSKVTGVKVTMCPTGGRNSRDPDGAQSTSTDGKRISNRICRTIGLTLDGVFVAIGHKPDTDLFKGQVELDGKGYLVTSSVAAIGNVKSQITNDNSITNYKLNDFNFKYQSMTSTNGVFAAGDCVDVVYRQAATAAGMGVGAALDIERWLETT